MPYETFIDDSGPSTRLLNVVAAYAKLPKDGNLAFRTGTIYYYPTAAEWRPGNRGVKCFPWDGSRTYTRSQGRRPAPP